MQSFFAIRYRYPGDRRWHHAEAPAALDYRDVTEQIEEHAGDEGCEVGGDPRNVSVIFIAPGEGINSTVTDYALKRLAQAQFADTRYTDWPLWLLEYAPADIRAAVERDQDRDYLAEERLE